VIIVAHGGPDIPWWLLMLSPRPPRSSAKATPPKERGLLGA
jgi:hypothetical protein